MELTFRGTGFASHLDANEAGKVLGDWLRVAGALEGYGIDLGNDKQQSGLDEALKPHVAAELGKAGMSLVPDVFGLMVYEHEESNQPVRFAMRAHATVRPSIESLREGVGRASSSPPLGETVALACDLVSLAHREASDRARLVAIVSAMEVMAERPPRTGPALNLVDKFIAEINTIMESSDDHELKPLMTATQDLKKASISSSIQELARTARPADPTGAASIARRAYRCRSQLLHGGRSDLDPSALYAETLPLVQDMIRSCAQGPT